MVGKPDEYPEMNANITFPSEGMKNVTLSDEATNEAVGNQQYASSIDSQHH
jgi:hypothetical protein